MTICCNKISYLNKHILQHKFFDALHLTILLLVKGDEMVDF